MARLCLKPGLNLLQLTSGPIKLSCTAQFSLSAKSRKICVDPAVADIPVQYNMERQVWVESLATQDTNLVSIMDLHPEVWAVYPRMDIIHQNLTWQGQYNVVDYNKVKNVREMIHTYGGGAKPWRQKGTGRARQGSTRAPQWVNGGKVHGPRGPKSRYYMIPWHIRVYGLTHTLSVKIIQDDIHVVEDLELPSDDPSYLLDLVRKRGWAPSVLMVDTQDIFPTNITAATEQIPHINLMPVYGLNVNSMIKHETLVITRRAVEDLTDKLLYALHSTDITEKVVKSKVGPKELTLKMEQHRPLI